MPYRTFILRERVEMRGRLTEEQVDRLGRYLREKQVLDLGCGDGGIANLIAQRYGASVVAVDSKTTDTLGWHSRVQFVESTYVELDLDLMDFDVGFISWPNVYKARGLERIVEKLPLVVYVGLNFDYTACGSNRLWHHLSQRYLHEEIPDPHNNVLVYGVKMEPGSTRPVVPEEMAALDRSKVFPWREFYEA